MLNIFSLWCSEFDPQFKSKLHDLFVESDPFQNFFTQEALLHKII